MANNNTEMIYREIIQKLCDHVKEDFLNEGIAEHVLNEMKTVKIHFIEGLDVKITSIWNIPISISKQK